MIKNLNMDKLVRTIWLQRNADPSVLEDPAVVAQTRAATEQAQAQQQGSQTAGDLAGAGLDAAKALQLFQGGGA